MSAYCAPCQRSFKTQGALDQHIQNSFAHKKFTQGTPQVQTLPQANLLSVKPKQEKRPSPSQLLPVTHQVKPAEPRQTLESNYRAPPTTTRRKHEQPPNKIASSFHDPRITRAAVEAVPQDVQSRWSVIPVSEYTAVLNSLSAHCHSLEELKENGYLLHPYDPLDYVNSRKCKRCNSQERNALNRECTFHPNKRNKWNPNRPYKCCRTEGRGCMTLSTHDFQISLRATKHKDFLRTPAASADETKLCAVTLDCEMAGVAGGASEAIFLCVTDYITGALLLNHLVCPSEKITQIRSSIHGISKSTLDAAIRQGQALSGWEGARKELWKYIDENTILVGHALEHDLDALRILHPRVVDSGILARNAVGIHRIRWGLKTLCPELLDFEIRENKGGIHDCLEDVLATREVVLFCTRNKEAFQSWAKAKKIEETRLEKEREAAREKKKNEQAKRDALKAGAGGGIKGPGSSYTYFGTDSDEEILYWSDMDFA